MADLGAGEGRAQAGSAWPDASAQNTRLGRGVNVIGYDPIWHDAAKARFTADHFRKLHDAGFQHVRINLHPFRDRGFKDGKLDEKWLRTLDWAIDGALANHLMVVLDFHEFQAMAKDPAALKASFVSFWTLVSEHCKDRPADVVFEILNEPNGKLTAELWNEYLREALGVIRRTNPHRTVIVGPVHWNAPGYLHQLSLPSEDRDLIVTFHYYSPFEFTHQGAPWANLKGKTGVSWTATPDQQAAIRRDFDAARAWSAKENRPLYLGEFGAYDRAEMPSRACWTNFVAREAEARGWSWAYWQFDGDFVLYDIPGNRWIAPIRDALIPPKPAASEAPKETTNGRTARLDVRAFGAKGDGTTDDTAAIQRAIDRGVEQGGGVVVLDRGKFLSGSLILRSHVELHLESTATLLGIADLARYHVDPKEPYRILAPSLIFAEGCEHVAITGSGTIDGHGKTWTGKDSDPRPVLIRLRDCRDVRLEGFLVRESRAFGIHPIHCRQVRIEGVRIDSTTNPNTDGIDIDGCQDVFVSNCNIRSADDSIALKAIERGQPCRDIVVTNCILSSRCAAIRLGPDAVEDIERVTVSNCVIRDTPLNGVKLQESLGAAIRDCVFSNLVMDNVSGPISIRLAGWKLGVGNVWAVFDDGNWPKGSLRNILFSGIRATVPADATKSCISITGTTRTRPRDIRFSNLDITFAGGGTAAEAARRSVPDLDQDYPEMFIFGVLPAHGLYVHHADGITLDDVRFHVEHEDLRPAVTCDDASDVVLRGLQLDGNPRAESLIRLQETRGAFLTGCRVTAPGPAGPFVRVEGAGTRRVVLKGNDLGLPSLPASIGPGASADAVSGDGANVP